MDREALIQNVVEAVARCQRPSMRAGWTELGLSHTQMSMLYLLSYHKSANVKQIADFMGVTKSAVTQVMDPLVEKGLVNRRSDSRDRRVVHLALSAKGSRLVRKLARYKFAGLRSALETLDNKDLKQIHSLFNKLNGRS